jgi:hypothetical protein
MAAKKPIEDKMTTLEKIEIWFAQRALYMLIGMTAIVFLALSVAFKSVHDSEVRDAFYKKLLDRATKYAVVTDGVRLAVLKKQPLTAAVFRSYVRNEVYDYFILDRNAFLDENGRIPILRSYDEKGIFSLGKLLPRVGYLFFFFDPNDKQSTKALYAYLKYLYGMARSGDLPDTISPTGMPQNEKFKVWQNQFSYSADIPVVAYYVGLDGKVHKGTGTIHLSLDGVFDPEPGKINPVNPYGMIVKKMKFKYIKANF